MEVLRKPTKKSPKSRTKELLRNLVLSAGIPLGLLGGASTTLNYLDNKDSSLSGYEETHKSPDTSKNKIESFLIPDLRKTVLEVSNSKNFNGIWEKMSADKQLATVNLAIYDFSIPKIKPNIKARIEKFLLKVLEIEFKNFRKSPPDQYNTLSKMLDLYLEKHPELILFKYLNSVTSVELNYNDLQLIKFSIEQGLRNMKNKDPDDIIAKMVGHTSTYLLSSIIDRNDLPSIKDAFMIYNILNSIPVEVLKKVNDAGQDPDKKRRMKRVLENLYELLPTVKHIEY